MALLSKSLRRIGVAVLVLIAGLAQSSDAIEVTFRVDLSIQESLGRFEPENGDEVEVRGAFNQWSGGDVMDSGEDEAFIFQITLDILEDPGSSIPFKFVMVDDGGVVVWESDVGEQQSNRTFVLGAADQALPVLFFDNLEVDPGGGVDVTFRVDLAARVQDGAFDPSVDVVEVRGPFNNWEGGDVLEPEAEGSTLYSGTVKVEAILPGSEVPYKYIINGGEWEGGENRRFVLKNEAHALPVRFFDDVEPEVVLPLGQLGIGAQGAAAVRLFWENPNAVLQGTPDLAEGHWDRIPVADGATEVTIAVELADQLFFRLSRSP